MAFGQGYQVNEDYNGVSFKAGEWNGKITKAELQTSKSGNEMAVLSIEIENQGTLRHYLVDDKTSQESWERTNKTFTRFFDCFKIQRGNFNLSSWVGKIGKVKIDKGNPREDGKQFFEIKWFLVEASNNQNQQFGGGYNQQNNQGGGYPQQRQQQLQQPSAYQPKGNNQGNHSKKDNDYETDYSDEELDFIPF